MRAQKMPENCPCCGAKNADPVNGAYPYCSVGCLLDDDDDYDDDDGAVPPDADEWSEAPWGRKGDTAMTEEYSHVSCAMTSCRLCYPQPRVWAPSPRTFDYEVAASALVEAKKRNAATPCTCGEADDDTCAGCDACDAYCAAWRARDEARAAWLASDEPRDWEVRDDSAHDILSGIAPDDVKSEIEAWLQSAEWGTSKGPLHRVAYAHPLDPATGELVVEGCVEVEID